jgi:hypothetical protein
MKKNDSLLNLFSIYKNQRILPLVMFLCLISFSGFGQVSSYIFSETTTTPVVINGTDAIASGWDDESTPNNIPIGFTFNFNGANYTTCSINSNGYITFGAITSTTNGYYPISSSRNYNGAISGYSLDLIDDNNRAIEYLTSGTMPNRVFTIQWRQARRFGSAEQLSFQIKLFETTNIIQIIYANFSLDNTNRSVQVGLRGTTNTDFNNRSLTSTNTPWDNNTISGVANTSTCRSRNNNSPSTGLTFTWSPATCLPPSAVTGTATSATAANLSWTAPAPPPSNGYQWEVRTSGAGGSGATGLTDSGITGAGVTNASTSALIANTTYTVYVRSNCGVDGFTSWVTSSSFYTGYCIPQIVTNTATYINNFSTSSGSTNISNLGSGFTTNGYQDNYATMTVSQYATGSVNFNLALVGGSAGVAIWVDWNNNFVFETTERVFNTAGYVNVDQNGTITVPSGTALGDYRMRVKIDWSSTSPDPCNNGGTRAETEDYKFTVITTPPCAAQPTVTNATLVTPTTARLNWTAAAPAPTGGYQYYYSTLPTAPTAATVPSGSVGAGVLLANIAGLTPNTQYYYWVRSYCNTTDQSTWVGSSTFTTLPVPPMNDECSTAVSLTVNTDYNCGTVTAGTVLAATNSGVDVCAGTEDDDVWYSFVATSTAHRVSLLNIVGNTTNMYHAVYDSAPGCGGLTTAIVCSDADTSNLTGLTIGNTYYVQVYTYTATGNRNTTFNICIGTPPPPPANDLCVNATNLPCGTTNLAGTTNFTSDTSVTIGCTMSNYGVWYTFIGNGDLTTITVDASFDTEIGIASGSCGSLTNLACNDTGNPETYSFVTTNGVTYYVYVAYWTSGSTTGNFTISRSCTTVTVPPNDLCNNATTLPCGTTNLAGTTNFTTNTPVISGCSMSNYGVWYTFVGDGQASTISSTAAAGFDHEMSISTGNCVNQESITCEDNAGSGGTETYTFNTTLGVQYYVYIAYDSTYGDYTDTGNFTISRTCSPPTYCIPSSTNTSEYINNFTATGDGVSNINNLATGSGITSSGYSNYSQAPGGPLTVTQIENGAINFTVNMTPTSYSYGFNVWVDWNDDYNFTAAELVYASGAYITSATGSFTIPGGTSGTHIMRIRSSEFNISPPACGNISYGEAEDYLLTVTPLNCTANPSNVIATATSTITVNISWTASAPPPGLGYDYLVSTNPTGTPSIASGTTTATSVNITGLNTGTTYYIFVRGRCNATDQGYWVTTTVTTGCTNVVSTPTLCPTIIIDVNGNNPFTANPFILDPSADLDCNVDNVTLAANSNLRETTSYMVEQITYPTSPEPEYDFSILSGSAQAITSDDVWATSRTNLGFNFCFYNETFNQTLVGANGMITFDTANTPGSYCGWSFSNDLPSAAYGLFEKTIYGVYHDIDPRNLTGTPIKSRTVGTAPCRQFQVSWNNIPMFGDATRLYTGMIVLHETTNIIEVFIKEKRIENGNVSPWNGGNALVGIQGDVTPLTPNNQYSFAPCRNSLDDNWETTNEAWRFTPNGAPITPSAIAWYQGSVAPGNIMTANADNSVTVTQANTYFAVTSFNTCSGTVNLTDEIIVNDNRKVWTSAAGTTDWYTPGNWTNNAIPTSTDCVIIPDLTTTSYRSPIVVGSLPTPPPPGLARSLRVLNNGYLELQQYANLIITDEIYVENTITPNGKLLLRNGSNLIQVTNTGITNTGNIQMQRTVNSLDPQDYVYWSSPVDGFDVNNVSPGSSLIYKWIPTTAATYGTWQATGETMQSGVGYIIRGVSGTNPETTAAASTVEFIGRPRNGNITTPISRGNWGPIDGPFGDGTYPGAGNTYATHLDDNWNLIGNPYPSAISALEFISQNAALLDDTPDPNTPAIFGTVYLWRHSIAPSSIDDPFYGDYVYNYSPNDYIAHNGSGSIPPGLFNGNIGSGQSFFVLMDGAASTPSNVVFNNNMRLNGGTPNDNNEFFRTNATSNRTELERNRIWLDLIAPNNTANSILVGYIENATNNFDRLFDGFELSETVTRFYSLIDDQAMSIQGRTLPFDETDMVPLGLVIPQSGNYTIAINTLDGLFDSTNQDIFIEDTYTNIIHDLRIAPYSFNSVSGTFNDRFILRYTNNALSITEETALNGLLITAPNSQYIKVTSKTEPIKSIVVFDLLGRTLFNKQDMNETEFIINDITFSDGTYIVKAILNNGRQKTQKVVLKQ